jgi:hypothetical protein
LKMVSGLLGVNQAKFWVPKWTYKNEIIGLCNTKIPKNHHIKSITTHPNKSYFEKIIILFITEFRRNLEF